MNEKRSSFGSNAIEVIDTFFKQPEYSNRPDLIARFASWAVQPNGPGFFSTPTPDGCRAREGEEGYIVSRSVTYVILFLMLLIDRNLGDYLSQDSSSTPLHLFCLQWRALLEVMVNL